MKFVSRWGKVLATGLLAGLVAALFMTLVIALLRLFLGVPLPVELGGDRFLPTFNVKEFLQLLSANGGPIEAKRKAFLSGWGGQLAFGAGSARCTRSSSSGGELEIRSRAGVWASAASASSSWRSPSS